MTRDTADTEVVECLGDAEAYVAMICFKHGPPRLVGVELEWTVHHSDRHDRPLDPAHLAQALGRHAPATVAPRGSHAPLPHGSQVTVEPGGQVEISSRPRAALASLVEAVDADIASLDELLAPAGLARGETGIDTHREAQRLVDVPRYRAMQAYFDRIGPWGSSMMCSTASTQVCVDAGEAGDVHRRWLALHTVGPVLVALFANSPVVAGRVTGWASNRLRATLSTCPPFTQPVTGREDPVEAWVRTAMTAPVLCVRRAGDRWESPPMSFAEWVGGANGSRPTYGDLEYHLTTLFPPVRPRGYVEVRYLDAQPAGCWHHPLVLLCALLSSPAAVDRCIELTEHCADLWLTAARDGLRDTTLAAAARAVVELGGSHVDRLGLPMDVGESVLVALDRRTSSDMARRLPV
ncbi:MAG: glutamate-cysteine ligase family protein [Nocardioidaceae bacterium]